MKTTIHFYIILLFTSLNCYSQINCDIKEYYSNFIHIEKNTSEGNSFLIKRIKKIEDNSCISDAINNNTAFFDYILTNFSSNQEYQYLLELNDSLELHKKYIEYLNTDSLFNTTLQNFMDKSINKTVAKDSFSLDEILNIAVKYFSIIRLTKEGYYIGKVCVGINDIRNTEVNRNPFIEAFAFSSILKHYQNSEYNLYEEFVKNIKELYKVNLGINKSEKLLRAQGAMFLLMRNNEKLKNMLKSEYELNKEYLPFVLK